MGIIHIGEHVISSSARLYTFERYSQYVGTALNGATERFCSARQIRLVLLRETSAENYLRQASKRSVPMLLLPLAFRAACKSLTDALQFTVAWFYPSARGTARFPFCIGFPSRAIAIFIFNARVRTEDLVRCICFAISVILAPESASFRSRSSSSGDHGMKVISASPSAQLYNRTAADRDRSRFFAHTSMASIIS